MLAPCKPHEGWLEIKAHTDHPEPFAHHKHRHPKLLSVATSTGCRQQWAAQVMQAGRAIAGRLCISVCIVSIYESDVSDGSAPTYALAANLMYKM